ncbi:small ribosomal subunit Rsm22 family protein [Gracilinema caldarium]|uniref:small ribosomal subunit Rsm22 family protein n=1 Tax=Gracilinema caldarium TaxID=215591 RepID=UPI0026EFE84C|nr:small ribosomal subunit Rsm22 family protein [Gracilinema caldarium]
MPEKPSAELAIWEERLIREWRVLQGGIKNYKNPAITGRPSVLQDYGPLSRHELERAAADLLALQRGLTGDRALIGSAYMDEGQRLGAYLLFYWFTSYAQTWGMLDMTYEAHSVKPENRAPFVPMSEGRFRILDLGSGPAPCSLATADWLRFRGISPDSIEIRACDQSPLALKHAQALAQQAGYNMKTIAPWWAGTSAIPAGKYHIITIGHMLNELWKETPERLQKREAFIAKLGKHLEPGGILIILEPALLATGRDLLALRDRLVASDWRVLAPCFTQRPCPAFKESQQTCHSDFAWNPPRTVRDLAKKTGLDKDLVKTTALVMSRREDHLGNSPVYLTEARALDNLGSHPKALDTANYSSATEDTATAEAAGGTKGDTDQRGPYRIVSEPMLNKAGRTRLILCGDEGRIPFSAKLGEGLPGETQFRTLRRSDAILLYQPVRRETGLALGEQTRIKKSLKLANK